MVSGNPPIVEPKSPPPTTDPLIESLQEQLHQSANHFGALLRRVEDLERHLSTTERRLAEVERQTETAHRRINERWGTEKAHCPRCGRIITSTTGKCGICGVVGG